MTHEEQARAWYAEEMAEQPADCACYEAHIAALVLLLRAADLAGAERMRERAGEACKRVMGLPLPSDMGLLTYAAALIRSLPLEVE